MHIYCLIITTSIIIEMYLQSSRSASKINQEERIKVQYIEFLANTF